MKLNEIAIVIAGYTFREAIKPDDNGDIFVFQAKDIARDESFNNTDNLTKISHNILEHAGYLKKSDILLVARGMKSGSFRSTVFASEALNVIASSSIHIIRVNNKNVLPEYVSNYLNSKEGQDALSQIVSGSYIGALPRRELEKIKIPIPDIDKQKAIVSLYQNMRNQQKILSRKKEIQQNIINEAFRNITTK